MADDNEFEFPPDHADGDAALTPEPELSHIPFAILTQTPTEKLPPTHVPGAERRSIRQMLKGALHSYHRKPPFSALADLNLPHLRLENTSNNDDTPHHTPTERSDKFAERMKHSYQEPYDNLVSLNDHMNMNKIISASSTDLPQSNNFVNMNNNNSNDNNPNEANDPHVLHSNMEFDIAHSEQWGPKRAVRSEWSEKQVREFYNALSQYGTDFTAIAILFKNRTRVDIKRLYNRELRRHPNEVRVALENRTPIDLNLFNKLLKTRRREEAPRHKVLAADEEQMLKQIASFTNNISNVSNANKNTTTVSTNDIAQMNQTHTSFFDENNRVITNNNNLTGDNVCNTDVEDEFAFNDNDDINVNFNPDEAYNETDMVEVRRQVIKPLRLNNNNNNNTNNNGRRRSPQHRSSRSHSPHREEHLSNTSNEIGVDDTYARQHKVAAESTNIQNATNAKRRQLHEHETSSQFSTSSKRARYKGEDETVLEMELRQEQEERLLSKNELTLAEAALAGEFGELDTIANNNSNFEDSEFSFDDIRQ